jgi:hypothetical protein
MTEHVDAIEIDGLGVSISSDALAAVLRKERVEEGIEVRLAGLRVRVPETALNAVLATLNSAAPDQDQTGGSPEAGASPIRLDLAYGLISVRLAVGDRQVSLSIPLSRLAVSVGDDELRVDGD